MLPVPMRPSSKMIFEPVLRPELQPVTHWFGTGGLVLDDLPGPRTWAYRLTTGRAPSLSTMPWKRSSEFDVFATS